MSDFSESFPPVLGREPRVLILGTLPGKESLRKQQYYGHPRNAFWPIIFDLFGGNLTEHYSEKLQFAKQNNIALWDVCHSALRPGSLDADISKEEANGIMELLDSHPSIRKIAFNGQKAAQLYDKYFVRREDISYFTLLSTSPANAAYSLVQKLENWRQII